MLDFPLIYYNKIEKYKNIGLRPDIFITQRE